MNDSDRRGSKLRRYRFGLPVLVVLVLLGSSGCGPSRDEQAKEAYDRGFSYNLRGEREKAIAEYSEAIRLKPNYLNSLCNRGELYAEQGETDKAIADFSEFIRDKKGVRTIYDGKPF